MEKYGVNELRKMFLEFFESKGHLAMKSFSLIPHNDKSLLLINSGMAPLKPYFTGAEIPPRRRVTTCQKCIRMLTFLPLEQIDEMDSWEGSKLNEAKEILAYELTSMVHGEEEAKKAQEGARAVFSTGSSEHMPTSELSAEDFTDDKIDIVTLLVKAELAKTRNEGRRAVEQGGVSVDGEKITDPKYAVEKAAFGEDGIVLKKGKKNFKKICVK